MTNKITRRATRLEAFWIGLAIAGLGICLVLVNIGAFIVVGVLLIVLVGPMAMWQGHRGGGEGQ